MKLLKRWAFGMLLVLINGCQSGPISHYYVTPIITGQVLDKSTDKPLSNVSIYENSIHHTKTDNNGYFKLSSFKFSYTASDYDVRSLNEASEGSFSLYKEGYITKDFWNFGLKTLEVKQVSEVPYHIHLGKVYLDPLPAGISINDVENDYIKKMSFCQLNESQREVNCLPLPDGVAREAVE